MSSKRGGDDALIGKQIGQCVIEKKLGAGGMGMVYLARHSTLNKRVAIKLLRQNLPTDSNGVERFVREARAAASLDHPSIVDIYDAGHENGVYYIVMQYVEGESLGKRLKRRKTLAVDEALSIFTAAAEGIAHAHSHGVIHRDIKPDNILLGTDGSVKIVDFGLARVMEYDVTISQTGTVVGSPAFMSPEQALGKKTDARTDIYSLGATLYQMVTGVPPVRAKGFMEAIWKVVRQSPQAPHQLRPEVSLELSRYIHGLMRKDAHKRTPSIRSALEKLRPFVGEDCVSQAKRRRRWVISLSMVAAVLLLIDGWYFVPWKQLVAKAAEHLKGEPPAAEIEVKPEQPDAARDPARDTAPERPTGE